MAKEKGGARTEEFYAPVEISDVMPDGFEIQGGQSLKDYLLETRRRDFARAMVAKLTSYGLGRTLEFSDEPTIEQLTGQFEKRDYRLDKLIESIVLSDLFLTR